MVCPPGVLLFFTCRCYAALQSYADRHAPALTPDQDALASSEQKASIIFPI